MYSFHSFVTLFFICEGSSEAKNAFSNRLSTFSLIYTNSFWFHHDYNNGSASFRIFSVSTCIFEKTRYMHLISQPPNVFSGGVGCSLLSFWSEFIYNTESSHGTLFHLVNISFLFFCFLTAKKRKTLKKQFVISVLDLFLVFFFFLFLHIKTPSETNNGPIWQYTQCPLYRKY